MNHRQIEQAADEAFQDFWKKWHSMDPAALEDAGEPTAAEVFHHGWRAALKHAEIVGAKKEAPNGGRVAVIEIIAPKTGG